MNFFLILQSPQAVVRKTLFPKGSHCDSNFLSNPQTPSRHPTRGRNHTMFRLEGTSPPLLLHMGGKTEAQRGAGTQARSPCSSGARRAGAWAPWPRLEHFPRRTVLWPHPEASLPVLSLWWDPVAQSELQMSPLTSPFPSTVSDSVESQPWKEPGREAARRFPELRRRPPPWGLRPGWVGSRQRRGVSSPERTIPGPGVLPQACEGGGPPFRAPPRTHSKRRPQSCGEGPDNHCPASRAAGHPLTPSGGLFTVVLRL